MIPADAVAGLSLLLFGIVGVCLFGLVTYSMLQMIEEIVGFRFLISQAITDILLLLQFAVWPGITILCHDEILPVETRWHVHIYLDFTWWAMVYHYSVVAWSRWAAVQWPNWFRVLPPSTCLAICAIPWVAGLTQSVVEHQFDWFIPLYFNPERYGMDSDWAKYEANGTNTYYMVCNVVLMVLPFPLYAAALITLFRRQAEKTIKARQRNARGAPPTLLSVQRQMSIETRLLVPCIINTILFVVGQIFISQCSKHGKWMNWAVMVVFTANSLVNPLLYLFFSSVIRKGVLAACRDRLTVSAIYDYELRSSSCEQRASLIRMVRDTTVNSQLNRVPARTQEESYDTAIPLEESLLHTSRSQEETKNASEEKNPKELLKELGNSPPTEQKSKETLRREKELNPISADSDTDGKKQLEPRTSRSSTKSKTENVLAKPIGSEGPQTGMQKALKLVMRRHQCSRTKLLEKKRKAMKRMLTQQIHKEGLHLPPQQGRQRKSSFSKKKARRSRSHLRHSASSKKSKNKVV